MLGYVFLVSCVCPSPVSVPCFCLCQLGVHCVCLCPLGVHCVHLCPLGVHCVHWCPKIFVCVYLVPHVFVCLHLVCPVLCVTGVLVSVFSDCVRSRALFLSPFVLLDLYRNVHTVGYFPSVTTTLTNSSLTKGVNLQRRNL